MPSIETWGRKRKQNRNEADAGNERKKWRPRPNENEEDDQTEKTGRTIVLTQVLMHDWSVLHETSGAWIGFIPRDRARSLACSWTGRDLAGQSCLLGPNLLIHRLNQDNYTRCRHDRRQAKLFLSHFQNETQTCLASTLHQVENTSIVFFYLAARSVV